MSINVQINRVQLEECERLLSEIGKIPPPVASRAINETLAGVKTDISSYVRDVITAKKSVVDENIKVTKASVTTLSGVVTVKGKAIPLIEFGANQVKAGVTAKIYVARSRELFTSAFISRMKSGHLGVFKREYKGTPVGHPVKRNWFKMPKSYRLPIRQLFGPQLLTIVQDNKVMVPVMASSSERMEKAVRRQLDYEMSRLK